MQHATLHFIFGPVRITLLFFLIQLFQEKHFGESLSTGCQTNRAVQEVRYCI